MKKILAVLLSLVMAFTFMMPTFAADEEIGTTENSSISGIVDGVGDLTSSVTGIFSFVEDLFAAIHGLVHNLSVMFDFDCPFDKEKVEEKPSEPSEPEESEPVEPSNPGEIVPDEDWYDTQASYIIKTAEELAAFAYAVNSGKNCFKDETVILGADIDLAGDIWVPIGTYEYAFEGTFDGKGHTISNLYIHDNDADALGLFGVTSDAIIKNVNINNVDITGYEMVAALVAYPAGAGTITNCHVSGDISLVAKNTHVGGIAALNSANIENCSVIADDMGKIIANEKNGVGGIVAWNLNEIAIKDCQVKNMEITAYANVGAIAGFVNYSNVIEGCVAENITLTKTRDGGHPTIGLAAGGFNYNATKAITIKNNSFKDITLVGNADTTDSANVMYGAEYSGKKTANFVMEGNSVENINLGLLYN